MANTPSPESGWTIKPKDVITFSQHPGHGDAGRTISGMGLPSYRMPGQIPNPTGPIREVK